MADIRPFQAVRPAEGYAQRVAALPYDVYSRAEAYPEAAKDRLSFLNIDRPETQFAPDCDMYAPEVYREARRMLDNHIRDGIFVQDPGRYYYIYELTMDGRSQTGIVACASVDDYRNGVIRKHENTRADKEADRIRHVDACSAQTGPVFLAYRQQEDLRGLVARLKQEAGQIFDFTSADGIRHRGWCIQEECEIAAVREAFDGIDAVYIADGHHRAASAAHVAMKRRMEHPAWDGSEEFNYMLSVLFPDEELRIMDYNRVVRDLNGLSEQDFLIHVSEKFEIGRLADRQHPRQKGEITMYLGGQWYRLVPREELCGAGNTGTPDCGESVCGAGDMMTQKCVGTVCGAGDTPQSRAGHAQGADPVAALDVSLLQRVLLAPVLGINDPKSDSRISFVGGIRGLEELERRVDAEGGVAFAMYPTSIAELFAVADAGLLMPPKSTWFEPKLRSGLFLHRIEE